MEQISSKQSLSPSLRMGMICNQTAGNDNACLPSLRACEAIQSPPRHCEARSNLLFFWIASPTSCLAMTDTVLCEARSNPEKFFYLNIFFYLCEERSNPFTLPSLRACEAIHDPLTAIARNEAKKIENYIPHY